jgi:hypothetical protein
MNVTKISLALLAVTFLSCGGNDGGASGGPYKAGQYPASSSYAHRCVAPRSGTDPFNGGAPFPDVKGSADDEKLWLRSWIHELYLWYREVPDLDPAGYATDLDYFDALKTPATTPSGKDKDQFHFTFATTDWEKLSQSGIQAGYGVTWAVVAAHVPRQVVAAYDEPNSPAAAQGVGRGVQVVSVDGTAVVDGDANALNAGLFPAAAHEQHTFVLLDPGSTTPRTVTLTSDDVTGTPVQNVHVVPSTTVGYMLFNDHLATAEKGLYDAVNTLQAAGVTDLVIDIRYNGGGFLAIASELAYMIAGPTRTTGKTFEKTVFNDKYTVADPVTGQPLTPTPFYSSALGFAALQSGTKLPNLNLPRVVLLTGPETCSASESIINSLQGIDVQVVQIGATTCGKPYGFYPQDNCGTTYFSIEFQGVNAKGFGDYADGFTPGGTAPGDPTGCQVADDLGHALGDPAEARLAAALQWITTGQCPPPPPPTALVAARAEPHVVKSIWHMNRW